MQSTSCVATTVLQTSFQSSVPKYIRQQGNTSGICFDIITELNRRLQKEDILIQYPQAPADPFMPWKRIQFYLESGKLDIVVGMAKNTSRLQRYAFSKEALYTVHSVFAAQANNPFLYHAPADLKGKHIIAVRGTKTSKFFSGIKGIHINLANTPTAALQMLLSGRGDLVLYHDLGLAYIIKENNWQDKVTLKKGPDEYRHFIAYNTETPQAVQEKVDSALVAMKKDGTMNKILDGYR